MADVVLRLSGTSTELVQAVNAAKASISGLNVQINQLGGAQGPDQLIGKLHQVGSGMQDIGRKMAAGITLPILGIGAAALKIAGDFESAFANVRKTIGDSATPQQLAEIRQGLLDLSSEVPKTTTELANIAALGGQFGISAGGILEFTRNVAALDVAVDGISGEQAAEGLAQFRTAVGGSEKDIRGMASALVALGNDGASSEAQILEFAQRLGGAGLTVGMTSAEVMGLGATLANLGINAEAGGTAMSRTMQQMFEAVKTGGDELSSFARISGQTVEEFTRTMQDKPVVAVGNFVSGLAKIRNEGGNVIGELRGLGAESVRQVSMLLQLATASGNVANTQGQVAHNVKIAVDAMRSGDAHLKEAGEKYKTLWNQLVLVRNEISKALLPIGESLIGVIKEMLPALTDGIKFVGGLTKAFGELPGVLQAGIFGAAGIAAIAPVAIIMIGSLINATGTVWKLVEAIKALQAAQAAGTLGGIGSAAGGAIGPLTTFAGVLKLIGTGLGVGAALAGISYGIYQVVGAANELNKRLEGKTGLLERARVIYRTLALSDEQLAAEDAKRTLPGLPGRPLTGMSSAPLALPTGGAGGALNLPAMPEAPTTSAQAGFQAAADRAKRYADDLARVGRETFELIAQEKALGTEVKKLAQQFGVAESSIERFLKEKQGRTAATRKQVEEEKRLEKELKNFLIKEEMDLNKWREKTWAEHQENVSKARQEAAKREIDDWRDAEQERKTIYQALLESRGQLEADSLERRLAAIHLGFEEEKRALDTRSAHYIENLQAIEEMEERAARQATREWEQHVRDMEAAMPSIKNVFKGVLADIPNLIADAFTGGGGIGGGLKAIASKLGGGLLEHLFTSPTGLGQSLVSGIGKLFGNNVAGAFAGMLGPIAGALGALAGPLLAKIGGWVKNIFGGGGEGRDLVKAWLDETGQSFDSLRAKLNTLSDQAEANRLWIALTQGSAENNPTAAKAAIDAIVAAFEKQGEAAKQAAEKTETAQAKVTAVLQKTLDDINSELDSLNRSIADEAPERVMGHIERKARERIRILEEERKKVQEQMVEAAKEAEEAAAGAGGGVRELGDRLKDNARDWKNWADDAVHQAGRVERAIDGVNWGHSPGGLKEIPLMLTRSSQAMREFRDIAVRNLGEVERRTLGMGEIGISGGGAGGGELHIHIDLQHAVITDEEQIRKLSREIESQIAERYMRRTQVAVSAR